MIPASHVCFWRSSSHSICLRTVFECRVVSSLTHVVNLRGSTDVRGVTVAGDVTPSPGRQLMAMDASPNPPRGPVLEPQHATQHAADHSNRHTGIPDFALLTQDDRLRETPVVPLAPQLQD